MEQVLVGAWGASTITERELYLAFRKDFGYLVKPDITLPR
jgi:hypothetical protein